MAHKSLSLSVAATLAVLASFPTTSAFAQSGRVGGLECNVSKGVGLIVTSKRSLSCVFSGVSGRVEHYRGTIRRFGLDVGITGRGKLLWAVIAAAEPAPGALAGNYVGASGSISVIGGVGANALVGGLRKSFTLQPLSAEVQTGANLAAGVGSMRLEYVRPR